jgi:hypothetical protein
VLATRTVEQWKAIRRKGQQAHILTVAESAPLLLQQVVDRYSKPSIGGSVTEPGDKQCAKCQAVVKPSWRRVSLGGEAGWVAKSSCPDCAHHSIHISGSPGFTLLASSIHQSGGDLDELPSL